VVIIVPETMRPSKKTFPFKKGGETASTEIRKLKLHTEDVCHLVNTADTKPNADDYAYALAA
jgi:hypothetical protein